MSAPWIVWSLTCRGCSNVVSSRSVALVVAKMNTRPHGRQGARSDDVLWSVMPWSAHKHRRPQAPRARHVLLSVGPRRSARVQARPRSRPRQACDLAGHLTRGFRLSRKFIVLVLEVSTLRTPSCGGPPPAESAAIAENFLGRLRECSGASSEPRVRAMVAK